MLSVESIFYTPRDKNEEARAAAKCFASPEGDHITLINVYRAAADFLEKRTMEMNRTKSEKVLGKWCNENFINSRSLRHARDIHRQIRGHVQQMATEEPDGTYRASASGQVVQIHPSSVLFRKKPDCIIFNELIQTNNKPLVNRSMRIRLCPATSLWR
ncbi:RNA helicase [Trifolium repens]|nr:RNA helicase [Trifolium repens]